MKITIKIKKRTDGGFEASAIVDGVLFRRVFYGYTKLETERQFREDVRIMCGGK